MEKSVHVKGHYRNGKYIKSYNYIRTFKEPSFRRNIGKSYADDVRRKIIILRKYSDFQSPEYQFAMDYIEKECPEVAYIIGDSKGKTKSPLKITKDIYDKVNYAYNILYSK